MTASTETYVDTPLGKTRVWEAGTGSLVGYFAGYGGLVQWLPLLDALADNWLVKAPSLPGFPGGPASEGLDDHLDWLIAAHDSYTNSGLQTACLVGASIGGAIAADIAAIWPNAISRLVLVAPFGVFDENQPVADIFAQEPSVGLAKISNKPDQLEEWLAPPDGANAEDWAITQLRAKVAAADILWPLGDTGLRKRLARITCPTLIIWGEKDQIIPSAYAEDFAQGISGPTEIQIIKDAGHTVEFDQPVQVAEVISKFLLKSN